MTREKKASITLELMMIGLTYKLNGNEMLSENEADSTRNAIDALDVAIAALRGERDTTTTSWYSKKLYCDTCGERIIGKKHNFCPMCGRKLEVEG